MPVMRNRAALALIAGLFVAACTAAPPVSTPTSPAPGATDPSPDASPTAAPFPVTIEHKFGAVTIPAPPTRVLTLGFSEQDPVLALGIVPVAIRDWFGDQPFATWPWAREGLGGAEPAVLDMPFGELNYEAIAAQRPDLIVAVHSGITEEEYRTLSEIAPTLAQPGDYPDFGVPWQEQTRLIGRALGLEDRANQLVADLEAEVAAVRREHPQFDGATVAWAFPAEGAGQYWAVGPTTPPMRFLASLGFEVPTELGAAIGDRDSAQISREQLQLLDADVLIWQFWSPEQQAAIEGDPLYLRMDASKEGRAIFFERLDDPLYGALSFSTVLSLQFALENLIPRLVAAVDGDPATAP